MPTNRKSIRARWSKTDASGNFTLSFQPPAISRTKVISQSGQGSTVEIVGPLGTMKMEIPSYMSIQENEANRTRTLHILDAEDRKQREMWGE